MNDEDLEVFEIIKEYLFYVPNYYHNQADWDKEYISMSYLTGEWGDKEKFEKVKKWCFKNHIRGTENGTE